MDPQSQRDDPRDPRRDGTGVAPRLELADGFAKRLADLEPEALAQFYEAYFERVYGYVRRLLGEESLAEDVTQDIFMHIQRSLHTYDPARELAPWVFTIATNKVRDFWRSRRHRDSLQETSLDLEEAGFQPAAHDLGPLPALENQELGRLLDRAIDELPESMRATLTLRWFEGLSFEAIAALLQRNETAVRKRYSRALEELRRTLTKSLGLQGGGRA